MEIARHWRLNEQRYRMIGDIDKSGKPRFPPREVEGQVQQESKQELKQQWGGGGSMTIFLSAREASMSSK